MDGKSSLETKGRKKRVAVITRVTRGEETFEESERFFSFPSLHIAFTDGKKKKGRNVFALD